MNNLAIVAILGGVIWWVSRETPPAPAATPDPLALWLQSLGLQQLARSPTAPQPGATLTGTLQTVASAAQRAGQFLWSQLPGVSVSPAGALTSAQVIGGPGVPIPSYLLPEAPLLETLPVGEVVTQVAGGVPLLVGDTALGTVGAEAAIQGYGLVGVAASDIAGMTGSELGAAVAAGAIETTATAGAELGLAALIGVGPSLAVAGGMAALPLVVMALTGGFSDVNRDEAMEQLRWVLAELARYGNDVTRVRKEAPHIWNALIILYSRAKYAASIGRGDEVDTPLSAYPAWLVPVLEAEVAFVQSLEVRLRTTAAQYNTTNLAAGPDITEIVLNLESRLGRTPTYEEAEREVIRAYQQFSYWNAPDTGR